MIGNTRNKIYLLGYEAEGNRSFCHIKRYPLEIKWSSSICKPITILLHSLINYKQKKVIRESKEFANMVLNSWVLKKCMKCF